MFVHVSNCTTFMNSLPTGQCHVMIWLLFDGCLITLVSFRDQRSVLCILILLYMQGMGEPMNNYNALVEAIGVFTGSPFQLSPKRITVSTVSILNYLFACEITFLG